MNVLIRTGAMALVLAVSGPAVAQTGNRFLIVQTEQNAPVGDVLDVAAATGQFTQFLAAVQAAGFEETLRGEGPFTIFAPTDEAFRALGAREVERLMRPQNHEELLALLAYHVVAEDLAERNIGGRLVRVEAASGYQLTIDARNGLRVNDTLVAMQDVEATNGTLHGVNTVLQPPVLIAAH